MDGELLPRDPDEDRMIDALLRIATDLERVLVAIYVCAGLIGIVAASLLTALLV